MKAPPCLFSGSNYGVSNTGRIHHGAHCGASCKADGCLPSVGAPHFPAAQPARVSLWAAKQAPGRWSADLEGRLPPGRPQQCTVEFWERDSADIEVSGWPFGLVFRILVEMVHPKLERLAGVLASGQLCPRRWELTWSGMTEGMGWPVVQWVDL